MDHFGWLGDISVWLELGDIHYSSPMQCLSEELASLLMPRFTDVHQRAKRESPNPKNKPDSFLVDVLSCWPVCWLLYDRPLPLHPPSFGILLSVKHRNFVSIQRMNIPRPEAKTWPDVCQPLVLEAAQGSGRVAHVLCVGGAWGRPGVCESWISGLYVNKTTNTQMWRRICDLQKRDERTWGGPPEGDELSGVTHARYISSDGTTTANPHTTKIFYFHALLVALLVALVCCTWE